MNHGCTVTRVLAVVDRLQAAEQLFRDEGILDFQSIFTIRDFGVTVDALSQAKAFEFLIPYKDTPLWNAS